jgi:hypothetical protein
MARMSPKQRARHDAHHDDNSSAGSVETDDVLSNAATSESGHTEDHRAGIRPYRPSASTVPPPPPVPATCTMCDVAVSEYVCAQCGRLSFCLKCSVSLHDNKFLGSHKLTPADDPNANDGFSIGDLKQLLVSKEAPPPRPGPPPMPSSDPVAPDPVTNRRRWQDEVSNDRQDRGGVPDAPPLDLVQLASDRRLLRARITEVGRCAELLRGCATKAAHEKAHSAEATKTAAEAVRRRFDLVRQLLAQKEQEYVEVIEGAGKRRLDAATKTATAVSVAATETEAYVKHMTTQLERLEGNNKQFNDSRRQLLEDVAERTRLVDQQVMDFERSLDDVQRVSLGVPVHLNMVIDTIQALEPPAVTSSAVAPAAAVIPAGKFLSEIGVQQWQSDGTLVSRGTPAESEVLARAPTPRKSLAQHVEELRHAPMPVHAASSIGTGQGITTPRAGTPTRGRSPPRSPSRGGAAPSANAVNGSAAAPTDASGLLVPYNATTAAVAKASIARSAARYQSPGAGGDGAGRGSVFPAELDLLKKHIAQRTANRRSSAAIATEAAAHGGHHMTAASASADTVPAGIQPRFRQPVAAPHPATGRSSRGSPLRQQHTASPAAGSRGQSPMARQPSAPTSGAGTPSSRAMSPTALQRIRMAMKGGSDTAAAAPGPGQYFGVQQFTGRSVLSTPPRRTYSPRPA